MNKFRVQRYKTTVTIPVNNDTADAPAVGQLNGILRGITLNAPALTGTAFTLWLLGQRGETLFTKTGNVEAVVSHINSIEIDSIEYPMSIPLSLLGVSPVRIKSTGTPDATGVLTIVGDSSSIANNDTVTIDGRVYRFRTTTAQAYDVKIVPHVAATAVLTSDATNPTDGDTLTLGAVTYTFKDTLSTGPTVANEIKIGASAAVTLDNVKLAVNAGAGIGTNYSTGTVVHPTITATTNTDTEQTFEALTGGTGGNALAKAENSTHLDFDGVGATFTGGSDQGFETLENLKLAIMATGTGDGSDYHAGTLVHPTVTATRTNGAITVTAVDAVDAPEDVDTTESSSVLSWGAATLVGGGEAGERELEVDLLIER